MHKKIVDTCSPNNKMQLSLYSVYRQEIPWRLFLLTAYVPIRDSVRESFACPVLVYGRISYSFFTWLLQPCMLY